MKKFGNPMSGYRVNEYMIVIRPHAELSDKIKTIKEKFYKDYRITKPVSNPKLILATFSQYAMMEERLMNRLNVVAMGTTPFKVEIKDFGSFPSHTIYFNVTSKLPVQALMKDIRSQAQRLMKLNDDHKPYFANEPHITIANKLVPWQYEKAWLEYSNVNFTGRFIASNFELQKRPFESAERFVTLHRFDLQNLPVNTVQGNLFG